MSERARVAACRKRCTAATAPRPSPRSIGQEHVTEPLQQALKQRPRPPRLPVLRPARLRQDHQRAHPGPLPELRAGPDADAVRDVRVLRRPGPRRAGHLDVIEIDAASHGGVDDARDLRERAFFSPASARYKVYIIDEAHMVSAEGFNALLKLVEEPPEHVKFIFATTEPDKVIATIRSRTHHYPFRLVPPGDAADYLANVCEREEVEVEPGVLPLVVRAGARLGPRLALVLDQLMAGRRRRGRRATPLAVSLLGYTDASPARRRRRRVRRRRRRGACSRVVDQVVEAGHDPRRFAEDLLERLRDLVIVAAVPEAAARAARRAPGRRARADAPAGRPLRRGASCPAPPRSCNDGLHRDARRDRPRLQLELICARVLLPGADDDGAGLVARLERLERRLAGGELRRPTPAPPACRRGPRAPSRTRADEPPAAEPPTAEPAHRPAAAGRGPSPHAQRSRRSHASRAAGTTGGRTARSRPCRAGCRADGRAAAGAPRHLDARRPVRRMWPDVLEVVKGCSGSPGPCSATTRRSRRRPARLTLAMVNAGARDSFLGAGSDEIVREALIEVLGVDWRVEAIVDPSAVPAAARRLAHAARLRRPGAAAPAAARRARCARRERSAAEPAVGRRRPARRGRRPPSRGEARRRIRRDAGPLARRSRRRRRRGRRRPGPCSPRTSSARDVIGDVGERTRATVIDEAGLSALGRHRTGSGTSRDTARRSGESPARQGRRADVATAAQPDLSSPDRSRPSRCSSSCGQAQDELAADRGRPARPAAGW